MKSVHKVHLWLHASAIVEVKLGGGYPAVTGTANVWEESNKTDWLDSWGSLGVGGVLR